MKLKKEIVFQTRRGKKKARYQWMELWGTNSLWGLIKTQEESEVSERKARWEETSEEAKRRNQWGGESNFDHKKVVKLEL